MSLRRLIPLVLVAALVTGAAPALATGQAGSSSAVPARPLTNLAHLDFLRATVDPPQQAGHTTYRLDREPRIGVLWTYAEHQPDGSYRRVGGGSHDPATNRYGQGAFNADDIARASVVYVRHWQLYHDPQSRQAAVDLLRGLTYLQTSSGPNRGNVVLWMQPDGTLNPSANPPDSPDPSDSGPSYWLARTVWALGEAYAAFHRVDPAFASFLRSRLDLAIDALARTVLTRYGQWQVVDGRRLPAWLVVDGADASSEAVLGLVAYVRAGGGAAARRALAELAEGIAAMSHGDARTWPYGAVLPWALSISDWHAWAAQMPSALAQASEVLGDTRLLRPALRDAAVFTPELITAGGPDNGWLPAPVDRTQIAYGVDARVQSLLAVATAAGRPGLRQLAGLVAAWYFGANAAGIAMYDPATGRTFDGVAGDGTVNLNSGAESTIHGLLSMLALDAAPDVAAVARSATAVLDRDGLRVVEAESARLTGNTQVVRPASAWTGESLWSGGGYVALGDRATASWTLRADEQPRLVQPVVDLVADRRAGRTRWTAGGGLLGSIDHGSGGPQGPSAAPGALLPVTLQASLPAGVDRLDVRAETDRPGQPLRVDALLVQPVVSRVVFAGGTALLHSVDRQARTAPVVLPGHERATVWVYDADGRLRSRTDSDAAVAATVLPGGFTVVTPAR